MSGKAVAARAAEFFAGMNRYDKAAKRFERFKCINPLNGVENRVIFSIYPDRQHNVWVGTLREADVSGALYLFNPELNRFDAFDADLSDLWTINEDRSGQLWAGNLTQLIRIDKKNKRHGFYDMEKPVRSVQEDIYGNFWVGTEGGGLILFDRDQHKIIARYTTDEGLCNNSVLNILYDGKDNLWISTFNGIAKFNVVRRTVENY